MSDNIKYLEEAIQRVDIEAKQHYETWSEASNKASTSKAYSSIGAVLSIFAILAVLSSFFFDTNVNQNVPAVGFVSIIVFFYYSANEKYQKRIAFSAHNSCSTK